MPNDDLASIYIRTKINDEWGSHSLRELLDKGHGAQITEWFVARVIDADFHVNDVTENGVQRMLWILEHVFEQTIYRLKPEEEPIGG